MNTLIDDLTDEPHAGGEEMAWYDTVKRIGPNGNTLTIEIEVLVDWDGTPEPEVRDYARIPKQIDIGDGLLIKAGSIIYLTKAEVDDFQCDEQVTDYYKEGMIAAEDVEWHNRGWDRDR